MDGAPAQFWPTPAKPPAPGMIPCFLFAHLQLAPLPAVSPSALLDSTGRGRLGQMELEVFDTGRLTVSPGGRLASKLKEQDGQSQDETAKARRTPPMTAAIEFRDLSSPFRKGGQCCTTSLSLSMKER